MRTIRFKNQQHFEGRNGFFKASGVDIHFNVTDEFGIAVLSLWPVTSKNKPGRGFIQIDGASIEDFLRGIAEEAGIEMLCGEELNQYYKESIKCSVEDFTMYRRDGWQITEERAQEALERMIYKHDASIGISWDSIEYWYDQYGEEVEEGTELWRKEE